MHLSRVRVDLNNLSRSALFAVMEAQPYGVHQLLWRLFPGYSGARPFLFRQEMEDGTDGGGRTKGLPLFYLLSEQEPVALEGLLDVESKPFSPRLEIGDRFAFRLRANPTVARRVEGKGRSRRSDVLMHAKSMFPAGQRTTPECKAAMDQAALHWLTEQGRRNGFSIEGAPDIGAYRQHCLQKSGIDRPIQFSSVDYVGVLKVVEAVPFTASLLAGLGRSKAFGFGMLMIRRA